MIVKLELREGCKLVKLVRGELVLDYTGAGFNPAFVLSTSYQEKTPVLSRVRVFVDDSGKVKI